MHGVTTAIVGFIFVCVVFPHLVRNRPQFYGGMILIFIVILLDGLGMAISGPEFKGFRVFAYIANAVLQVGAILVLFLSAGGITWRALAGDMAKAIEVIRRGEEEKEIIIPLSGQKPKVRDEEEDEDEPRERYDLTPPPPRKPPGDSTLPLD